MIRLADYTMLEDLRKIRRECFGEEEAYLDLYFNHRFEPENTLVYQERGHAVASLTMLPCTIITSEQHIPASYIYAVATLPAFQGRGISHQLSQHAENLLTAKNIKTVVLIPATVSLFDFYAKQAYTTCFYRRKVVKKLNDLPVDSKPMKIPDMSIDKLYAIRNEYFVKSAYFVEWDIPALQYAIDECEFYGGKLIWAYTGEQLVYAFCYMEGSTLIVKETIAEEAQLPALLYQIKKHFPLFSEVTFYCAGQSLLFKGEGEPVAFGMYKSLHHDNVEPPTGARPYIGLIFD